MYGIAIDVGTSGTRMHAVDLESKKIISTAITVRHPVPGANVMTFVKRGGRLLDPFCGTGGVLIEAATIGVRACGSDISPTMSTRDAVWARSRSLSERTERVAASSPSRAARPAEMRSAAAFISSSAASLAAMVACRSAFSFSEDSRSSWAGARSRWWRRR